MRLTVFSDYTLRVLIYLGLCQGRRVTIEQIASAYGISRNHLTKVVNLLATSGYVDTSRGKGGGLRLKVSPGEVSLGKVLRESESDSALVECFKREGSQCRIAPACAAQRILGQAEAAFYRFLEAYTLADLLQPQRGLSATLGLSPKGKSAGSQSERV
ncbi:MAG: Rrf2 family transcriptional regulator [Gammaproteobacteria bacterium]|nr:Rrf2 family transcriptional regulator [Gammaproteobacteria bacterium]